MMTGMSGTMRGGGGGREAERGGEGEAGAGQEATFTFWTAHFNFTDETIYNKKQPLSLSRQLSIKLLSLYPHNFYESHFHFPDLSLTLSKYSQFQFPLLTVLFGSHSYFLDSSVLRLLSLSGELLSLKAIIIFMFSGQEAERGAGRGGRA